MFTLTDGQGNQKAKDTRRSGLWLYRQRIAHHQQRNNMTEHEQNLRDLAAMFAMTGLIIRNEHNLIEQAFSIANDFMETREFMNKELDGIAALKRPRKAKDV